MNKNHTRWTQQVYTECVQQFENPTNTGIKGIGVVLHDEKGVWFGGVDVMRDKWIELATEENRRKFIDDSTP